MCTALVIEENKLISWSLKEILVEQGFKTLITDSYELALNIAEKLNVHFFIVDCEHPEPEKIITIKKIHIHQPNSSLLVISTEKKSHVKKLLADINHLKIVEKPLRTEIIRAAAIAAQQIK